MYNVCDIYLCICHIQLHMYTFNIHTCIYCKQNYVFIIQYVIINVNTHVKSLTKNIYIHMCIMSASDNGEK